MVVTDKYAMMREAYRYELQDADSDITLTGTVYSEMQGAYYSKALSYTVFKEMFPGSWHSTCTGGKPGVIEQMTQQDLADFHSTYYKPSNAVSILYGDLNLPDFLELIASYYDEFTPEEVSSEDSAFTPIEGYQRVDLDIPASTNEAAQTTLVYAVPLRGYSENDVYMLRNFLDDAVGNSSGSFYRIIVERFPSSSAGLLTLPAVNSAEPMVMIYLFNANGVVPEDFVSAVNEGVAAVLEEGIRYDVLETNLKTKRMEYLRLREDKNIGISFSETLLTSYADTGNMYSYPEQTVYLLENSEEWLAGGILESVIEKSLINPADSRLIVLTKKPGSLEEINAVNAQKLADMKAAMSEEEIDALVESTQDYSAWLDAASSSSQIDEVKALTVKELPEKDFDFTTQEQTRLNLSR